MTEIRSRLPLHLEDKITPRVLDAFKSGLTKVTMEGSILEIETEDGCCIQLKFKNIAVPVELDESDVPYLMGKKR
jgi:hypothetical protein